MVAEFDDRDGVEDPQLVEDEISMLEGVNVTLDEQKIGTALHGQEATTGNVDTVSCGLGVSCDYDGGGKVRTFEVFNRCSGGCL